jgi:hypothetical protein
MRCRLPRLCSAACGCSLWPPEREVALNVRWFRSSTGTPITDMPTQLEVLRHRLDGDDFGAMRAPAAHDNAHERLYQTSARSQRGPRADR